MATIQKIGEIDWSVIKAFSSISANTIGSISGIDAPSGGGSITFSDMTHTCSPNTTISNTIPYSVSLPSTAVVGSLVFIFFEADFPFTGDNLYTPPGWTKVFNWNGSTSDTIGSGFWKILTSTDISAGVADIYSFTTYSSRDCQSWSWICNNVDTTNPISDVGSWSQSGGISKTIAGITPSADGLAVGFWGFDGGDGEPTTITAGWTKIEEVECDGGSSGTFAGFASLPTTSGVATGNLLVTALVSDGWGGIMINFKQA